MNYRIVKLLGKGAYGSVYLAKDKNNENVAIKKFYMCDSNSYNSFKNEIKILKKIKSKYLIKIYDYYKEGQYMYMVMEYAPHGDLDNYIKKINQYPKKINNKFVDNIIFQLSRGLDDLHKNKIIHRDIKTSNILIFNNNQIKITDFGVSKMLETNKLVAYSSIGTPYYMPPEMIDDGAYDYSVDYWALGCLIYKILTNRYPFQADNIIALFYKIKKGQYDISKIPYRYRNLVSKLLDNKENRANFDDINKFFNLNFKNIKECENFINIKKINIYERQPSKVKLEPINIIKKEIVVKNNLIKNNNIEQVKDNLYLPKINFKNKNFPKKKYPKKRCYQKNFIQFNIDNIKNIEKRNKYI